MKETLNWNFCSYKFYVCIYIYVYICIYICAWIKNATHFKIVIIQDKLHLFLFTFLEDLLLYIIAQQIADIKLIENETLIKIPGGWMK